MQRRQGVTQKEDFTGDHTFGHNLLTLENVKRLAESATHWAIIIHFENAEKIPNHNLFPSAGFINLFEQGKLCRASLLAGFKTKREPQRPVPACFFRTLDYLLQFVAAGNVYRPINDKEDAKGFPPAAWCRPPVVASVDDAAAATAAAVAGETPAQLERVPATDPIRLFYSARSWCYIYSFHVAASTVRVAIGASPEDMYAMFLDGALSEYSLMVGLLDPSPPTNLWVPPCVMMPLGALKYMHGYGRPYLPMTLSELRTTRATGVWSLGTRADARPLPLPPGVLPPPAALPPGMESETAEAPRGGAAGGGGGGGGANARAANRGNAAAAAAPPAPVTIPGFEPVEVRAAGAGGQGAATARGGGGGDRGGNAATAASPRDAAPPAAPKPKPEPEPDPILNSSNWIMPKPFDTPIPPPPSTTPDGGGNGTEANGRDSAASPSAAVAALPPSPFLGTFNYGVQPTFETPPLRLFLGERGQAGLSANWWFVDSETGAVRGPHSPEQMMLSYVAGCRELHEETPVCGTEADVRPPMSPPTAAFLPLRQLLQDIMEPGQGYVLVTRADIVSPLAQRFLGNRVRAARPPTPTPSPAAGGAVSAVPTVSAMQAQASAAAQPAPAQQQQSDSAGGAAGAVAPPAATVQFNTPQPPPQSAAPLVQLQQQPSQQQQMQLPPQPATQQQQMQPLVQPQAPPQQPLVLVAPPLGVAPMAPQSMPHVVRPMMLPPHMGGPRPRPLVPPGAPPGGPAPYGMPGPMMFVQGYGSMPPYGGPPVLVQPVLGAMTMQPPPPPPPPQ